MTRSPFSERRLRDLRAGLHAQLDDLAEPSAQGHLDPDALLPACVGAIQRAQHRGTAPHRRALAAAVRASLDLLAARAPGNAVEVRVPPFGAVQCLAGPRHTRGTPPSVIEADPATWLALASGALGWAQARAEHRVSASGARADLGALLPLLDSPPGPRTPDDPAGQRGPRGGLS